MHSVSGIITLNKPYYYYYYYYLTLLPPHFAGHKPQDGLKCTWTEQCPDISLWSMGPLMLHSCYPSQPQPVSGCSNRNLKQLV